MTLAKLVARKLTQEEQNSEIDKMVVDFQSLQGLRRLILFGSAASGQMTEASDLDVVAIFDTQENARNGARFVFAARAASHRWPADILCVDEKQYLEKSLIGGVFFVARTEGKVVWPK